MNSLISAEGLGRLARPVTKLIDVVARGAGVIYAPTHKRRMAQADIDVMKIAALGEFEIADIRGRAEARKLHEECRRQSNVEAIVEKALKMLPDVVSEKPVDDDWTHTFFKESESTSDSELQELWAKILSAEVTNPGQCSKRTLRIVQSMERNDADAFMKFCSFCCHSDLAAFAIPIKNRDFLPFSVSAFQLKELDTLGLVDFENKMTALARVGEVFRYFDEVIRIASVERPNQNFAFIPLTQRGCDLRRVCDVKKSPQYIAKLCEFFKDEHKVVIERFPQGQ